MVELQYLGSKILREKCIEVPFKQNLNDIIPLMFDITFKEDGCGLAAPQVGLNKKMFIIDVSFLSEKKKNLPFEKEVFINPTIHDRSKINDLKEEGCLSIPGIKVQVLRPIWVDIEYWDQNWEKKTCRLEDIFSRIFLHEYDHLEGTLIIDKATKKDKKKIEHQLQKLNFYTK